MFKIHCNIRAHVFHCANYIVSLTIEEKLEDLVNLELFFLYVCVSCAIVCLGCKRHRPLTAKHGRIVALQTTKQRSLHHSGVEMVIWKPLENRALPKQLFPICRQVEYGPLSKRLFLFSLFLALPCICFCIITVYGFCIKCIRVLGCKWNLIHILSEYLL